MTKHPAASPATGSSAHSPTGGESDGSAAGARPASSAKSPLSTHIHGAGGRFFVVYRAGTMIATMMKVSTISPENATAPHAQARRFAS